MLHNRGLLPPSLSLYISLTKLKSDSFLGSRKKKKSFETKLNHRKKRNEPKYKS